jgi:LacI family transcriptional regulator
LAQRLKLSVTTVSRVLNGKAKAYRIKPETEQKVRQAAIEMNYAPNLFARGLKLSKSETIGIIVPDIANPFFADLIKVTESHCRANGYAVVIGDSNDNIVQEEEMIRLFKNRKVEGVIIAPVGTGFSHIMNAHKRGLPLVLIDRWDKTAQLPTVTSDNYRAAYIATEYIIENGHTSIACIQGLQNSYPNNDRVLGFTEAIMAYGLDPGRCPLAGNGFTIDNGYYQALHLRSMKEPPTAILALNNSISLGVLKAAAELKLAIPGDLSLVSFDEQAYSAYLNTPMTTIEQDKKTIGKKAVEILIAQINDPDYKQAEVFQIPTKMNVRFSVKKF